MQNKFMTMLALSLRLFRREFGRGELTIIALSIILAVSSVMALSSITNRIEQSITLKSAEFLAADRDLVSSRAIDRAYLEKARELGLNTDEHIYFSSMAFANDKLNLAVIKAVTNSYPLRGTLKVSEVDDPLAITEINGPQPGTVVMNQRLYFMLDKPTEVEIGDATLKVSGLIDSEPDAPFQVFSAGTRIIMHIDDVPATNIIQPGSRITYAFLFSGEEQALQEYEQWVKPKLSEHERFRGVKEGASNIQRSLDRAESFLMIAGVLGVILAATAVAVSARLYSQRHLDSIAIMKTLGASVSQVQMVYLCQLLIIALVSVVGGLLLGGTMQWVAISALEEYLPNDVPAMGLEPFIVATVTGFVCALMFSIPSLLKLFRVPPLRVLRRTLGDGVTTSLMAQVIMAITTIALVWFYSQNWKLTAIVTGTGVVLSLLIIVASTVIISGTRTLASRSTGGALKLALASLKRRSKENTSQMIGFTLAIMLMLILYTLKNSLIQEWQAQLPEGAPNQFVVNISEQELPVVKEMFAEKGIETEQFYPIIRGRLTHINDLELKKPRRGEGEGDEYVEDDGAKQKGKPALHEIEPGQDSESNETTANGQNAADSKNKAESKPEERGPVGIGRELNLTFTENFPDNNEIIAGEWMPQGQAKQVSVEEKVAERLQLELGDTLQFVIGAQTVSATVTSIRTVDWNSLQPNFYMIFSNDVIADFPATYISSFYLPKEDKLWLNELIQRIPTLSLIDIDAILNQVKSTINQVSIAIQFVLLIVVIAATLVLLAQVQSSLDERRKETVIFRTIGAKGSVIRNAITLEFLSLGAVAGLIAALVAESSLIAIQHFMFDMVWTPHWDIWLIGPLSGALFVSIVGSISTRSLLRITPTELIRQLA